MTPLGWDIISNLQDFLGDNLMDTFYDSFYLKAKDMRARNLRYSEIARSLKVPEGTVYGWLAQNKTPNRPRNQKLLPTANDLNPRLSYIMGVMEGDGCIVKSNYTIRLGAKDLDFVKGFADDLEKWSGIKSIMKWSGNLWLCYITSKRACEVIWDFDLNQLLISNTQIKTSFLRGIFDSEASAIGCHLDKPVIATRRICLYNTDMDLLNLVKGLLETLEISSHLYECPSHPAHWGKKKVFVLRISSKKNVKRYYNMVGFSIQRKQDKLKKN
jgi:intein-encoded DNA endonuclease-like protein